MIDSHTHTSYSKHADGSIDDLVRVAILNGVKILTITDHAPFFIDKANRLLESEVEVYLQDIDRAKAKYAGSIKILKGLEVDYMPSAYNYLAQLLEKFDLDFVIGSIHYIPIHHGYIKLWDLPRINDAEVLTNYFRILEQLLTCELFDAVGHADALLRSVSDHIFCKHLAPLVPLFVQHNIAYELNTSGSRKTTFDKVSGQEVHGASSYPSTLVLPQLITEGVPFTIGSDSHTPLDVGSGIQELICKLAPIGVSALSYFESRHRIDVPIQDLMASSI